MIPFLLARARSGCPGMLGYSEMCYAYSLGADLWGCFWCGTSRREMVKEAPGSIAGIPVLRKVEDIGTEVVKLDLDHLMAMQYNV
jgi:hypothetical protein